MQQSPDRPPLTNEQQLLVERSLPHARAMLTRMHNRAFARMVGKEDARQVYAMALCRAAQTFRHEMSETYADDVDKAFRAYAAFYVTYFLRGAARREHRFFHPGRMSDGTRPPLNLLGDDVWKIGSHTGGAREPTPHRVVEVREQVQIALSAMPARLRMMARMIADGYTQVEMARVLHLSKVHVGKIRLELAPMGRRALARTGHPPGDRSDDGDHGSASGLDPGAAEDVPEVSVPAASDRSPDYDGEADDVRRGGRDTGGTVRPR